MTLKDPDSPTELSSRLPLLPAWTPAEARVDVLSQGLADLQSCPSENLREREHPVCLFICLSVCLTDRPPYHNCTPRDCSERLPFWWTSSFF